MADTLIGTTVGKYKITGLLGKGGMAEVYKGWQENLDRDVAIKMMHAFLAERSDFLARFQREAKAMAALSHPNIVGVYDFDSYDKDTYYLVMEYISGGTLKELLEGLAAENGRLPLDQAVKIIIQIGEALAYAHARNMIHRDIKPANIMIDDDGKAILTDFGIVKLMGGDKNMDHTATGAMVGTPSYMSPEQALGKGSDARGDLYSLGIMLFQMTTGQLPFSADTPLAVVLKHVNEPIPLPVSVNPDLPQDIQDVILKATEKNPDYRYQTAREMVAALRRANLLGAPATIVAVGGGLTSAGLTMAGETEVAAGAAPLQPTMVAPPTSPSPPVETQKKGKPMGLIICGIFLLLLLLGGGSWLAFGRGGDGVVVTETAVIAQENSPTPTETIAPDATPDVQQTIAAAVQQTEEAQPTPPPDATATNTPTMTPTSTATPDATAVFLENCAIGSELIAAYPYQNERLDSVVLGSSFPLYFRLRNSGTCPWPDDLSLEFIDGEPFGDDGKMLLLETAVSAGEEIILTKRMTAPNEHGRFDSRWQLFTANGLPYADMMTFDLGVYVPVTPTPVATATPLVTSTPTVAEQPVDWIFTVGACEEVGIDWRCAVEITPYGGGGGPYTVWVFDQPGGGATEYRGTGPFTYFALARRCAAFSQAVKVQDDATGTSTSSEQMYIDPTQYYSCNPL